MEQGHLQSVSVFAFGLCHGVVGGLKEVETCRARGVPWTSCPGKTGFGVGNCRRHVKQRLSWRGVQGFVAGKPSPVLCPTIPTTLLTA